MDCSGFRARHLDYVDGTLDDATLVACERHRAECGDCAQFDTRVRRSLLVCHNVALGQAPCDLTARVMSEVRADRRRRERRSALGRRVVQVTAACAACAALISTALPSSDDAVAPVQMARLAPPAPVMPVVPVARGPIEPEPMPEILGDTFPDVRVAHRHVTDLPPVMMVGVATPGLGPVLLPASALVR